MLQEQNNLIMVLYIFNTKLRYGTYRNYDNTPTLKKVIELFAKKTGFCWVGNTSLFEIFINDCQRKQWLAFSKSMWVMLNVRNLIIRSMTSRLGD